MDLKLLQIRFITLTLTYLSTTKPVPVSSVLMVSPSNTVVKLGQRSVELKCTISNYLDEAADWWWVPAGGTELIPIFQSNTLVYLYDNHMEVVKGPQGQYNLVIHNVTFSDAGNYTCYDDARLQTAVDKGYFASAELVVIGMNLNCSHNMSAEGTIGGDICQLGLHPDYFQMHCVLTFHGNISPTLAWSQVGGESVGHVITGMASTNNLWRITSIIVVQANEGMNGSRFICSTKMIWNKNSSLQGYQTLNLAWSSPAVNLLFINEDVKEAVTYISNCSSTMETKCLISTNMACDYKWIHLSGNIVVKNKVLNPILCSNWLGTYQCAAECRVRSRTCHVNATRVEAVYCSAESQRLYNSTLNLTFISIRKTEISVSVLVILSLLILLCVVGLMITIVGCSRGFNNKGYHRKNSKSVQAYINFISSLIPNYQFTVLVSNDQVDDQEF